MKTASIVFLALVIVLGAVPAFSADQSNEAFYQQCFERTLSKYENKTKNLDSERKAIKRDAAIASLKAAYFKSNRDVLLDRMCAQNIAPERAKVDYFMTKSFGDHMGSRLDQAVAEIMGAGSAKEVFEAYSEPDK